ncbi:MAG: hypothetical protein OEU74_00245 [Gammaproteobacteria bacterium]|nr:hypothetical protein [Gammaproteobacteria bacterium]
MKFNLTRLHHTMEACNLSRWGSLVCLLSLLLAAPATMAGSIKCWINKDGIRECGYTVPPEYSQQRIEIMNQRGIVVEVKEAAKTKEQLAEEARLAKLKQEELRRQQQARLRDTILLNTFTTERDLKISYDNKIAVIMGHIDITNTGARSLNQNLKDAQRKAANYERAGEKPPENLLEEMNSLKRQIKDNDTFIARKMQEIKALNSQYEADLKRFRELKGITPTDTANK